MLVVAIDVDEAQIASLYSQLTGVLAGFSFAGLLLLVTRRIDRPKGLALAQPTPLAQPEVTPGSERPSAGPVSVTGSDEAGRIAEHEDRLERALILLLASFIGLSLASLAYAVIGGETSGRRPAIEHTLAGVGFGASALVLFSALVEILGSVAPLAGKFARPIVYRWAPILIIVYIITGAYDAALRVGTWAESPFFRAGLVVALVVPIVTLLAAESVVTQRDGPSKGAPPKTYARMAQVAILLTLVASLSVPIISALFAPPETTPFWPVWVALALATVGASAFVWFGAVIQPHISRQDLSSGIPVDAPPSAQVPLGPKDTVDSTSRKRQKVVEPISREILRSRSLDLFPQGYQTTISIVQGVALAALADRTINALQEPEPRTVEVLLQSAFTLVSIILVSYGYLWFSVLMRWVMTFRDIAVPFALGMGEIVAALLVGHPVAWWGAIAAFAALACLAYGNTWDRLDSDAFGERDDAREREPGLVVRQLLIRLMACCLAVAGVASGVAVAVYHEWHPGVLAVAGPLLLGIPAALVIWMSEREIGRVFRAYLLDRSPQVSRP